MKTILDASSVINLFNGKVLEAIAELEGRRFVIGGISRRESREISLTLDAMIGSGKIDQLELAGVSATDYLSLLQIHRLGEGETECLAAGRADQSLHICTDDARARRIAAELLTKDRVVGTMGLLREGVVEGVFSEKAAAEAYIEMRRSGGFLPALTAGFFSVR